MGHFTNMAMNTACRRFWAWGTVVWVLGSGGQGARAAMPPATPEDESVNWTVEDPVDQDYSEGVETREVRGLLPPAEDVPPEIPPVSIHQSELEYYRQFEAESESEWDAVQSLRTKALPLKTTALPKGGASAPGPFVLEKEVFGWHPSWEGTGYTNYTFDLLSTVAYFSYEVNPSTGYATTMNSWSNTPLVQWAHSNGTKVVLCATMMSGHTNFFGSSTAQSNLIGELIRVVGLRGADGVNIDFEAIPSGYRTHLTAFMSNLATRMHAEIPDSQVSICLPAVDWSSLFDVAAYDGFLDRCIIMGYDYSWSTDTQAGPVAPLTGSATFSSYCEQKSVSNYLALGISPGKLLLGVPYYGYDWPTVSFALHANTTGSGTARMYPAAKSYAATYGYNWDANSQTPYVLYGSYRQLWYDDTNSLALKYDFANSKNLAGIGIWALNYDEGTSDLWDLLAEKFATTDSTWTAQNSGTATNFYGVGAKASSFAAVGAGGAIYTSADGGATWTSRTSGTSSLLLNFASGSGMWVAVGDAGTIATSVGGATWTVRSTPTNAMLRGIAYGDAGDVFVAVGAAGTILRSTDGNASNWTQVASGTAENLQGVNYVGNLFIATGENSVLLTSSDGASWTARTSNAGGWLLDAAYGNGTYVAVGLGGRVVTSPNGATWTRQTNSLPNLTDNLYRVAFGNGQFVAVGQNGVIWGSPNGVDWTAENSGTTNFLRGVVYSNDLFMAAGYNGTILTKGAGAPSVEITPSGATVPNGTSSQTIAGTANAYAVGTMSWTNSLGGSGTFAAAANWSFSAPLAVGTNLVTVTATNAAGASASDSVTFIREPAEEGGGSGSEATAASQPAGGLSDIVVYTSAGHGFTYYTNYATWMTGRGLDNGVVEDVGNVDQLNYFADYCFKAGATVVPMRPLGQQTNEVVLDNTNTACVTFGGTWYDSSSTTFYGDAGATPYRYAYVNETGTTAWAIYRPNLPAAGFYPVYAWTRSGSDRVRQLYRVYHSGGVTDVRVNHRRVGLGWVWLGTYYFEAGTNGSVNISNYAPGGYLSTDVAIADAIRFGNGMGDINRGGGVSGFARELEGSRYWVQTMTGQGMSSTLYDSASLTDVDDNVGAPNRMAVEMNREADGGYFDRIYLGFHSNAGSGAGRGPMGLYDTRYGSPTLARQQDYATLVAKELTNDLGYGALGVWFPDSFTNNTANLYGSMYGEIYGVISNEMNTTIIEVGYHDNLYDTYLLRCPSARRVMAMASYQAIVKHLTTNNPTVVSSVLLPDPPTHVSVANAGAGNVTLKWHAPTTNRAGGHAATGYVVYRSTNGYGFGNPVAVSGGATLSATLTNMAVGQIYYFQVCATNVGGESLASRTVGVRVSPSGFAPHLVVNGFERNERRITPTEYIGNNIGGDVARVIQRKINSQDYVIQHGEAIAAAGRYFDSCANEAVADGDVDLTDYHAAYWNLGRESTADETFSAAEQTAVSNFLAAGNCLFASGTEIGWDLQYSGTSADKAFCSNVLKTAFVSAGDDAGTGSVSTKSAGIFDGVGAIAFDYAGTGTTYKASYPDILKVAGSPASVTALVYGASSAGTNVAALAASNAYRLIVMGFPFETIYSAGARTNLMARTISFFGDAPADTPVVEITTANQTLAAGTASFSISGTNNAAVVGNLAWSNVLTGASGTFAASSSWSVVVSLATGTNLIRVTGNNYLLSQTDEDTATLTVSAPAALSSALSVTLQPAEAVSAGAQWRVDGGAWRASGAVATGLTAGAHTVSFGAATGWIAPADVATATTNGTTNSFTATYVAESSGPVTIFEDNFEDGDLAGWTQDVAGNWTNSTDAAITGSRSLKHNLSGVAATNCVYAQPSYSLAADTTTWRFKLKNGNWDPSSDNRYHVFLAASAADFTGSAVDGYAVGINFTGTDDLVKLWRIAGGGVAATVLTSAVDWNAATTLAIEVTRSAAGLWELKTSTNGAFSGMASAGTATDTAHTDTTYFGLYFKCTSTRAGQVWLDDVLIHQGELTGETDSDGDGMPDEYESAYFNGATNGLPDADDDEDGMSNYAEYVAGTHPGSGTSVLALDPYATNMTATANLIFRWPSVTGRTYSIMRATNVLGPYTQHVGSLSAHAPTNTLTNAAPAGLGTYFYGIGVQFAP